MASFYKTVVANHFSRKLILGSGYIYKNNVLEIFRFIILIEKSVSNISEARVTFQDFKQENKINLIITVPIKMQTLQSYEHETEIF